MAGYIYGTEHRAGANALLKSTPRGGRYTLICKYTVAAAICFLLLLLFDGSYFLSVLSGCGASDITSPVCSMEHLERWGQLSIRSYLILLSVQRYIGLLLASVIILAVSSKIKSYSVSAVVNTAVLALPVSMTLIGQEYFQFVLLNPLLIGNVL